MLMVPVEIELWFWNRCWCFHAEPKKLGLIEATKTKMEKDRAEELKFMDKDRQKQVQLFYWCLTASALITYFFKLYK